MQLPYYQPPYCGRQEQSLLAAEQSLAKAEAELQNVQYWTQLVDQAVADYNQQAQRLNRQINVDIARASALLGRAIAISQSYTATTTSPVLMNPKQKGPAFEAWAAENVFHGKKRIRVPIELNQHLERFDEEGLGLFKGRSSDNYVDTDGSLWDAKAYAEDSEIDWYQLQDYALMERAGYVIDSNGIRVPIKSVNYLFMNRAAAEKNRITLKGEATAWYVEWDSSGMGQVCLLENQ
jgi:hypothetical protein